MDAELVAKLLAPAISALLLAVFKHYAEARAKVITYLGHVSAFELQSEGKTIVHTHSVVVQNAGKKAATNVRLAHLIKVLPEISVYPPIQYRIEENPAGYSEIVIPILVPKEQVTISYLYFPPVIWSNVIGPVKSDEGYAKQIDVIPQPKPSKFYLTVIWLLAFTGASLLVYWVVRWLIQYATP